MVTLNRNWSQSCYCRCLSDDFITIFLATQTMVDSNKQETKRIISLSVIQNYVHYFYPNLKKCRQDTRSCVVANVAYLPEVYIHHYCHGDTVVLKNSRISAKILKTEGLGKKKICIYETYKNTVMPHGRDIYAKAYDMEKATICKYPQSDHALPHWKYVLRCCAKCNIINITVYKTDDTHPNPSRSIH